MANKRFVVKHGLDNSSQTIINVGEPSNNSDAATKYYVDTHNTGGTVTSVTATSPVESTGGTTPVISLGTGSNGQLVIGTGTGFTKSTLTAGSGVSISNGSGTITISATGSGGDVVGPASSTDNAVVRFDGTTGKLIQNSTVTLSDTGVLTVPEVSTASITSTGNNPIVIAPDGTGDVHLNADSVRIGDNNADATIATNGTGDLIITTHEGSATQGIIRLYDGANGNITLTPNGTGQVQVGSDQVVTLAASQTLTNKSISGSTNTFSNIPNSATTATSANTASAIVARDASGNFSAGTITATLSGNATNVTGTVAVANGGTGSTTLTSGSYLVGNGTSAVTLKTPTQVTADLDTFTYQIGGTAGKKGLVPAAPPVGTIVYLDNSGNWSTPTESGVSSFSAGTTGFTPSSATTGAVTLAGTLNVANGGTGLTTLTAGYIPYGNGTSAFGSSANLFWDSTNSRLGIGTSSPASRLHVYTAATNKLTLDSPTANDNRLDFAKVGTVKWSMYSPANSNDLRMYDHQTVGDVVTFQSGGNLGLGTSSPSAGLHISKAFGSQLRIQETGGTYFDIACGGRFDIKNGSGTTIVSIAQSGSPVGTMLNLDSSGNLGIGNTPSYKLDVSGTIHNNNAVFISQGVQGNSSGITFSGLGSNYGRVWEAANDRWALGYSGSFGGASTEVLNWNSSGNVGIGTSSPGAKLDVIGSGGFSGTLTVALPSSVGTIIARNSSTTTSELHIRPNSGKSGWLSFTEDAIADRWIVGVKNGNGGLFFNTGNPGSNTDRMMLDSSGNVGIGTSTVVANFGGYKTLELNGTTGGLLSLDSNGTNNLQMYTNGSTVNVVTIGALPLTFGTNSTERMRIDSSGNLGIGTASPTVGLHVVKDQGSGYIAAFRANTSSPYITLQTTSGITQIQGINSGFTDVNNIAMQLSGGNVGIGTASPSTKLEVVGTTGVQFISTFRTGDATAANNVGGGFYGTSSGTAATRSAIMWLDADGANLSGNDYFLINKHGSSGVVDIVNASNAAMTFYTNDTERVRIDSSGNVAIGNTSPSEKLHVTGNIRASGVYVGNGSSGSYTKGFGGVQTTTSTSTPTGGSSGDFTLIY